MAEPEDMEAEHRVDAWRRYVNAQTPDMDIALKEIPLDQDVNTSPMSGRSASGEDIAAERARVDAQLARLAELDKERAPYAEPTGPGPREAAYEPGKQRPWMAALGSIYGHDTSGYNEAVRHSTDKLQALREADRAERLAGRPVDDATRQQLIRFGGLSADAVDKLTMDSPVVKTLGQGGLTTGLKLRAQDMGYRQGEAKTNSQERQGALGGAVDLRVAGMQGESRENAAKTAAAAKAGGRGGGVARDPAALAPYLTQEVGVALNHPELTLDIVTKYLRGTLTPEERATISPEAFEALELRRLGVQGLESGSKTDRAQASKLKGDTYRRQGALTEQVDAATQRKRLDPNQYSKMRQAIAAQTGPLMRARAQWRTMSDEGKRLMATIKGSGDWLANFKKLNFSESDLKAKGAIEELANTILKARSGAAVTGDEFARFASESGMAGASLDLFNDPAAVQAWMDRMVHQQNMSLAGYERDYPDMFDAKAQAKRGL